MFSKILIANRGEICCRVITTARRLGIQTVAVFSDADRAAQHVAMADEAVRIGPPPPADSYLNEKSIIEAALVSRAEAIHPGYGFLSENPAFVEAVEAAGLVFIGPSAGAIRAMGFKDAAKALMVETGVPVVPGYHGERQDPEFLAAEAERIGYPVLIKARAGGGGKGMRLVENPSGFRTALEGARREAEMSFGDPLCLIEKCVTAPRHIEVQIFGDAHGNVIHLFERDCSLQRRHQKVIEEAPAPAMTDAVRAAMGRAAVKAARAIGYQGAGTVEFIVDGSGPLREDGFWFMEMNTRLQVEHPVSEAITGLDFVELQFRVAAGEALPVAQEDLVIRGHAFEARLYAENVPKGFLPSTGRLEHLRFPQGTAFAPGPIRIDTGVREGDEISAWYDPMIAKLIVHGPTRAVALNMLSSALVSTRATGATTNLAFLRALTRHQGFVDGRVDTGLIGRDFENLAAVPAASPELVALAALAALRLLDVPAGHDPWDRLVGWRHWGDAKQYVALEGSSGWIKAEVATLADGRFAVWTGTEAVTLCATPLEGTSVRVNLGDRLLVVEVVRGNTRVAIFADGNSYVFGILDEFVDAGAAEVGDDVVIAPMPGLVWAVHTQAGSAIARGDPLIVLEAMKMEHTLIAPRDGTVAEVLAAAGDHVSDGTILIVLESHERRSSGVT